MPIQPKRRSAAKSTKSTKSATAPSGTSSKPFLRSYHTLELHEKAILVLSTLESARDPTAHRNAFADLAVELTNSGLHYYFIKPLKDAKAGFMLEQSASMGMVGVQQVIGTVIRNIIGRMMARSCSRSVIHCVNSCVEADIGRRHLRRLARFDQASARTAWQEPAVFFGGRGRLRRSLASRRDAGN